MFSRLNPSTLQPFNRFFIYFLLCFSPLIEGGTTYYPVAIIEGIVLLLLTGEMIAVYRGTPYLSFSHPIFFSILLFFLYLSGMLWLGTPYQLPGRQQIILFAAYFVVFYFSIYFKAMNRSFENNVYRVLWFMAGGEAATGISQFVFHHERAKGTFFNPDFFAGYLALLFCLFLGKYEFGDYRQRAFWRGSGFLALLGAALVLAQSRGVALAWVSGTSFVLWKRFRYKVIYGWLVLVLLLIIIPNPLQHRILHDSREDPYSFSRIEMWKAALLMVKEHPFGIGLEMYPYVSPQYAFPVPTALKHYGKIAESPHNEYLRLLAESGIPGGLLLLYLLYVYFRNAGLHQEDFKNKIGIAGALLVFMVISFFNATVHEPALMLVMALMAAFLVNPKSVELKKVIHTENIRPGVYYSFVVVVSLAVCWLILSMAAGWYFYSIGYVQMRQKQLLAAGKSYEKAIFFQTENTTYHNALANIYFSEYQISKELQLAEKSLEELDEALRLNPIYGMHYKLKGVVFQAIPSRNPDSLFEKECLVDALTSYKTALKYFPYDASILLEMGKIEAIKKNPEEALKSMNRAIFLEPNFMQAREMKITLLLGGNHLEEAKEEYREMKRIYEAVKGRAQGPEESAFIGFNRELLDKAFQGLEK
ncbi:MAG TPA: O-antigen ligase family protein [Nitrospiria bacterium]|nr:O-antigen ligase family protein [Nitrospiria bacterium]